MGHRELLSVVYAGGTVYLAPSGASVTCTPSRIIDKIAWGHGDCADTNATVAPGANNGVMRRPANACRNGQDTHNNAAEFVLMVPATPRN